MYGLENGPKTSQRFYLIHLSGSEEEMEYFDDEFDVIVVGAGVMGSSTAYQIAKKGKKILLIEQFDFLHHRGSSHGESRTIRLTYPEDYYSSMVIESSKLWTEAESEVGYKVLFKTSQLDMGPSDNKSLQAVITNCQTNLIPYKVLNCQQVHDEFSGKINLPENWVGVSTELGGVIKPTKAVSMFQTLALKHGVVLRDNTEVKDIKKEEHHKVRGASICVYTTTGERFWGKKCVVTVGAWMKKLIKRVSSTNNSNGGLLVDRDILFQPLETNVHYWRIKEGHEAEFTIEGGGFPTFASYGEPYIYGTPSLEFPGMIKIAIHGGQLCDPDCRTWAPPATKILDSLRQWIRGTFGDRVDSTMPVVTQPCMYTMTPDEDFVIDFLGGEEFGEDVVVAGGFSGHGFKMAPLIGKILADLVLSGVAKGVELKHFRLGRFEGNPQGNVKEFGEQVNFSAPASI